VDTSRQHLNRLLARLFTSVPLVGRIWAKCAPIAVSADVPWTPYDKPLAATRVCLLTTGGLHLRHDQPFNMEDSDGDPSYRTIPADARPEDLCITHNYYNHQDADRDFNLILPLERLRALVAAGYVGGLTPNHYSFMGHIDGPHVATLQQKILPMLLARLHQEKPDLAFLTPS